jgi:hypothetical protein
MLQKIYFYDYPRGSYPINDRHGRGDVNCDRRLDMRDLTYLTDMLLYTLPSCTCGTINPALYDDPELPDTVWVESETLIVGVSSPVCIGIINDEPLTGLALALEWDGTAVLELDWPSHSYLWWTERIDSILWGCEEGEHADGVNPDTFRFYGFRYIDWEAIPLPPGRDAVCCPHFISQTAGTGTIRLVSWVNGSESMLTTEDHAAILPAFYAGNITVIPYLPGDPNHDGIINSADLVYLINYLFVGGPQPNPLESGDANCDGEVSSADVVYLINYLFIGGPTPGC